jgi:hypothetical protein
MATTDQHQNVETRHRQQTRWQIILPAAAALLVIVICVGFVASRAFLPTLADSNRVSLLADWMMMVFMLCPAVICLFPLALLAVVAIFGMNKAHGAVMGLLIKIENSSRLLETKTTAVTNQVNQRTIAVSSRFGLIYKMLGVFERPDSSENDKGTHDAQ